MTVKMRPPSSQYDVHGNDKTELGFATYLAIQKFKSTMLLELFMLDEAPSGRSHCVIYQEPFAKII